ncbi:AAA family ATPase [Endozoicomonas ascidiicola]|uniref:AAA family ATPase n=1 Tax=Endozoicomonas ascidiicola TaxID=1698521 RepID=UPI0008305D3E|nr:helicase RepA family protein [Endozoicomonas ascidiicola]
MKNLFRNVKKFIISLFSASSKKTNKSGVTENQNHQSGRTTTARNSKREPSQIHDSNKNSTPQTISKNDPSNINNNSKLFLIELLEKGYDMEIDWIIKNYIPAGTLGVVYGASESFKTFHTISWAASIATGTEWNGAKCTKGKVLYIAAEGGSGAAKRAQGWKQEYNQEEEITNLLSIKEPINLSNMLSTQALITSIKAINEKSTEKLSTVFIDTLARCFGDGDENRAPDMNKFVNNCSEIQRETGATVIVVHHTGKNKEREARGSSVLRSACDFEYNIDRPNKGPVFKLKCTKQKDAEHAPTETFNMNKQFLCFDSDGDEITTLVPSLIAEGNKDDIDDTTYPLTKHQKLIYEIITQRTKRNLPTDRQSILNDFKEKGGSQKNFSRILNELKEKCIIDKGDNHEYIPIAGFNYSFLPHLTSLPKGIR